APVSDQLIRLPTGDGMALVFFGDAEAPARCALELGRGLRSQPGLQLRMGIHTGPVYRVADINANRNVAGGGINIAQRVMDCGTSWFRAPWPKCSGSSAPGRTCCTIWVKRRSSTGSGCTSTTCAQTRRGTRTLHKLRLAQATRTDALSAWPRKKIKLAAVAGGV